MNNPDQHEPPQERDNNDGPIPIMNMDQENPDLENDEGVESSDNESVIYLEGPRPRSPARASRLSRSSDLDMEPDLTTDSDQSSDDQMYASDDYFTSDSDDFEPIVLFERITRPGLNNRNVPRVNGSNASQEQQGAPVVPNNDNVGVAEAHASRNDGQQ